MPKPKRGPRLGAGPGHQKLLLSNQAMELFRHGRIRTTEAKARMLRPYAERLITKAKQGDLAARRQVLRQVRDRDIVGYLFEEIAPRFADRPGGYTRMLKLGPRQGDNAPMALVELVVQADVAGDVVIEEQKATRRRGLFGRRRRQAPSVSGHLGAESHEYEYEEQPSGREREVEEELDIQLSPEVVPEEAAPPGVGTKPSAADRSAVVEPEEVPGPAQAPTAPAEDPGMSQDMQPEDTSDAGGATGGTG